jgi:hypothetical protein
MRRWAPLTWVVLGLLCIQSLAPVSSAQGALPSVDDFFMFQPATWYTRMDAVGFVSTDTVRLAAYDPLPLEPNQPSGEVRARFGFPASAAQYGLAVVSIGPCIINGVGGGNCIQQVFEVPAAGERHARRGLFTSVTKNGVNWQIVWSAPVQQFAAWEATFQANTSTFQTSFGDETYLPDSYQPAVAEHFPSELQPAWDEMVGKVAGDGVTLEGLALRWMENSGVRVIVAESAGKPWGTYDEGHNLILISPRAASDPEPSATAAVLFHQLFHAEMRGEDSGNCARQELEAAQLEAFAWSLMRDKDAAENPDTTLQRDLNERLERWRSVSPFNVDDMIDAAREARHYDVTCSLAVELDEDNDGSGDNSDASSGDNAN